MERGQGSRTSEDTQDYHILVHENDLGGCSLTGDGATYYPKMWSWMVENLNIKSMIDVGCGAGFAVDYFRDIGVYALGVEGCLEAIQRGLLSVEKKEVVHHDYKNGIYIPNEKFDLCWSCEFVEHVDEKFVNNFIATFKAATYLAVTFAAPGQGGHHHVNEQYGDYWINLLSKAGFNLDVHITLKLREIAKQDCQKYSPFYTSHFINRGLFFRQHRVVNKDE